MNEDDTTSEAVSAHQSRCDSGIRLVDAPEKLLSTAVLAAVAADGAVQGIDTEDSLQVQHCTLTPQGANARIV